jgi:hypothetical protein
VSARRPLCGNDPSARGQLTTEDHLAVAGFREYLAARKALPAILAAASRSQWRVYSYDADQWMPIGSASDSPDEAREKQRKFAARYPNLPTAVVRETVTYTIEEQS